MKTLPLFLTAAAAIFIGPLAFATPPTDPQLSEKVDRTPPEVPSLQSEKPLYALLVFGKKASLQRWLVIDLEADSSRRLKGHIYIDCDGDRDLTEPVEKISLPDTNASYVRFPKTALLDAEGAATGYAIEVSAGSFGPDSEHPHLRIYTDTPGGDRFGAWGDQNTDLIFGASPKTAPVIHFDGPLQMGFEVLQPLTKKDRHWRLAAGVGTYGIGDGTFAYQFYQTIPEDVHPDVTIEWPAAKPGQSLRRTEFILKDRC